MTDPNAAFNQQLRRLAFAGQFVASADGLVDLVDDDDDAELPPPRRRGFGSADGGARGPELERRSPSMSDVIRRDWEWQRGRPRDS